MTVDKNKKLKLVEYNYLNLPKRLTGEDNKTIEYIYDANGQKLVKKGSDGNNTYYASGLVYKGNSLQYILTAEGMYQVSSSGSSTTGYQYNLKDHLGNVRLVVNADNIVDQTDYYPFGMNMTPKYAGGLNNLYKYNGKELQEDVLNGDALDWYDYGARFYDPALARFMTVDPKASKAPGWSPYRAFFCNPIRYTDPDGQWEWDKTGNLVAQKGDQSYSLATFLGTSQKNAMTILNRGGVTANDKGILNLKEGQTFAKSDLWVGFKSGSGAVVNNTSEAKDHYFNGNGKAADVGDNSTVQLLTSDKFQAKHTKITSQEVVPKGYFSIDMTDKEGSFHIGNTGVDYSVSGNGNSSSVTYTLFTNTNKNSSNFSDGFWDPNFVAERTLGKLGINRYKADEMGPNLEWGKGQPYPYKTRERTFFFKPVGQ
nr:RHS repeat-associated core domain-containing protein [uncultured Carboxylicivirga sp.]